MKTRPLKILLVDDHPVVRAGTRKLLAENFAAQFSEAKTAAEATQLCREQKFDLILLDVNLPDRSGLDLLAELKAAHSKARVLVMSMHEEEQFARRALKAGAAGYIGKASVADELVRAVGKILEGGIYVSAEFAEYLASGLSRNNAEHPHETLSAREFEVFRMIVAGKSGKEIAAQLSLSFKTVSTYRTRILQKLGVTSTAGLVQYASREGLI